MVILNDCVFILKLGVEANIHSLLHNVAGGMYAKYHQLDKI
jgi:hypothetical protein